MNGGELEEEKFKNLGSTVSADSKIKVEGSYRLSKGDKENGRFRMPVEK